MIENKLYLKMFTDNSKLINLLIVLSIATTNTYAQLIADSILAITKVEDSYPSWSPDGKKIAFQSNRNSRFSNIFIMNADGSNIQQITNHEFEAETPVWSPDGKSIMYCAYMDSLYVNSEIFLIKPDGTDQVRLTNLPSRDDHQKFSSNGKKIIFNSQRDDEGHLELKNYEIYEMNVDGSQVKRLTNYFEWDTYPSYSPDGKQILWRRILADTTAPRGYNSEIFVMKNDGSDIKNLSNHKSFDGYPEWSPDGKHIVFASSRHGQTTDHLQLFIMNSDGANIRQLTFNNVGEEDVRPNWSLNGKQIAFNRVNDDGTRIYVLNIKPYDDLTFFDEGKWSVLEEGGTSSRGVAWGDYNNDGFPDLLVANTMNNSDFLYKNNLQGDFSKVTEGDHVTSAGWTEGVNWIDYDNDYDLDIFYTTQFGQTNMLFRNEGDGNFIKVDAGDLTSDSSSSTCACWGDYDLDGDLDVYVVERDGKDDVLYNNKGEQGFKRVSKYIFPYQGGDGRACVWGDTNGDNYPELYVGNFLDKSSGQSEKSYNFYYKNNKGRYFSKINNSIITSERNLTYGLSFIDYDQDNDLDLFLTNIALSDINILYQNDGFGNFTKTNTSISKVVNRPSKGHTWGDYDNDGDLDLFIANGTEGTSSEEIMNFLFLNEGNNEFKQVQSSAIVNTPNISAGTAWADYDRDGDLDLFVANWGNNNEKNTFYKNNVYGKNWLEIALVGTESNTYGIGSKVRLKVIENGEMKWLVRWLLPQTGYGSQNELIIHFGLDLVTKIEAVEVTWPNGKVHYFQNIQINQLIKINEQEGIIRN